VPLPDFVRTTTFRWTLAISAAFAVCILLMFGFVYWQTSAYVTANVDQLNKDVTDAIAAADSPTLAARRLEDHLRVDPRRVKLGGLFAPDGRRIAGNVERLPPTLPVDGTAHTIALVRVDAQGREEQTARAMARRLANGETLLIARNVDELAGVGGIVERVLALGLVPALGLGLVAGALLSLRGQKRIDEVAGKVQRIVAGELRERLPAQGVNDPFDRLAVLVNGMLDEIETLVGNLAHVGDDIAHDLRTPLTRVRVGLERARQKSGNLDDLKRAVDRAIIGLDQSLAIITALLRIAAIEQSGRSSGFRDVALVDLVRAVGDLYEPIAEDKGIAFVVAANDDVVVKGDRDLLLEAVANLVDNAVKFTPEGGRVELSLSRRGDDAVVSVRDTGPGIAAEEREQVGRRFYRSDKSRRDPGVGLGLSLVKVIVKLHGFRFSIAPGPGCVAEIAGAAVAAGMLPQSSVS
jgi:signal transduction histidine kinase